VRLLGPAPSPATLPSELPTSPSKLKPEEEEWGRGGLAAWYAAVCTEAVRDAAAAPSGVQLRGIASHFATFAGTALEVLSLRRSFTARFEAERPCHLVLEMEGGGGSGAARTRFRLTIELSHGSLLAPSLGGTPAGGGGVPMQSPLPFAIGWICGDVAKAAEVARALSGAACEWGVSAGPAQRGLLTAMVKAASKVCRGASS
jgi:hypothetical protein